MALTVEKPLPKVRVYVTLRAPAALASVTAGGVPDVVWDPLPTIPVSAMGTAFARNVTVPNGDFPTVLPSQLPPDVVRTSLIVIGWPTASWGV